jgi:hypothetical protein
MNCSKCGGPRERANHSYCRACAAAYMRKWHKGEIEPRPATCTVAGCERRMHGRGLCDLHRIRLARHGSTEARPRSLAPKRYKLEKRPGHPLAHATTHRVYLHRIVLFDQIGFGRFPCFWCASPVEWTTTHPVPPNALITDHLDHNRHNNDPTNLVPACRSCNSARTRERVAPPLVPIYITERVGT